MNWTRFLVFVFVLLLFCFVLFFAPTAPPFSPFQNGQSQPLFLCDTYCMYHFEFHLQNQQLMCMLLHIESYIYISVCMFCHYTEFWYCILLKSVNFTGLGPRFVRWTWFRPQAIGQCRGCSCHGPGRGRLQGWDKTCKKCQRSHSGQEELQVIPRSLCGARQECKASHVIGDLRRTLHAVTPPCSSSFLGIREVGSSAAIVTTWKYSGVT